MCSFIAYGMALALRRAVKGYSTHCILFILIPSQMIVVPMMMNYSKLDILGIFGLLNKHGIDLRVNILGTPLTFLFAVAFRRGSAFGRAYIYLHSDFKEAAGRA